MGFDPKMNALSNDELRAKTKELQKYVQEYAKEEKAKIAELKAKIEDGSHNLYNSSFIHVLSLFLYFSHYKLQQPAVCNASRHFNSSSAELLRRHKPL